MNLKWTKELPTEEGHYWVRFRHGVEDLCTVGWCTHVHRDGRHEKHLTLERSFTPIEDRDDIVAWAGPIQKPEDA